MIVLTRRVRRIHHHVHVHTSLPPPPSIHTKLYTLNHYTLQALSGPSRGGQHEVQLVLGEQNLLACNEGLFLDLGLRVGHQTHDQLLAPEVVDDHTAAGVEVDELANVVAANGQSTRLTGALQQLEQGAENLVSLFLNYISIPFLMLCFARKTEKRREKRTPPTLQKLVQKLANFDPIFTLGKPYVCATRL